MIKTHTNKNILFFSFFLIFTCFVFSQTKQQIKEITKDYDFQKLKELETSFKQSFFSEKLKATKLAKQNGWPIRYTNDKGTLFELRKIANDGSPIYYQTFNSDAANSTRTDWMHNNGGLGLNIEGQGMTAHVWDAGLARTTHQEYDGAGGNNRFSIGDGTTSLHSHSAHVTGTIIASGFDINAKGMAPQASAIGYDWNSDLSEAAAAAANGMLLSNHSYGFEASGIPDYFFGAYIETSKEWDELMYNSPHYLMVVAAGNDGNDNFSNLDPLNGNSNFDKLSGTSTSKNNMVVANGQDATVDRDGILTFVSRNSGSSEGPTDDLRIKPDIMGNGTGLYSTYESSDSDYNSITGTSMASPNVCGSLLLLQQHYNNTSGVFMKAATLKGLALHTADDIATLGPDAVTGWGLMNTKVAAETITNNGFQSWISEEELTNGGTFTMTVQSDGTNPLLASISWTDQAGVVNTGTPNDATTVLVNDLDIKVTQGAFTGDAWKLTGVTTNTKGDNTVDPYERVDVPSASGAYTITVTHKGTLAGGPQKFSLILTGLSSNFTLNTSGSLQTICSTNDAIFNFDYQQTGGGTTNFSTNGVPAGATVNITPSSRNTNGTFDVTFGNLASIPANTYEIDVIGDDGSETESRTLDLRVLHSDFTAYPQTLTSPATGAIEIPTFQTLIWSENLNAEDYFVEVATDPNFGTVINSNTITNTSYNITGLSTSTIYYWRVRPNNRCNNGDFSETYSFQTGQKDCSSVSQTTPTTITDQSTVTSTINHTSSFTIDDVNVIVDYDHTWIGDVSLTLVSPLGTRVTLIDVLTCTTQTNFNFNFDDEALSVIDCATADTNYPTLNTYKPISPLSPFMGETSNGIWTLEITDDGPGDTGTLNSWELEICEYIQSGTTPIFTNNGFSVDTNSTYTALSGDIEATTPTETAAQQVYTLIELPTMGILLKNAVALNIGDSFTQDDVNTSKITYTNTETLVFADQFKVDIQNSVSGWLPNQVVNINGVLGLNEFELGALAIWPNPTSGNINIQINTATNADVSVNLLDIQGRKVFNTLFESNSGTFNTSVNFGNIANGMYLLDVQQGNKKTTKRIIISN